MMRLRYILAMICMLIAFQGNGQHSFTSLNSPNEEQAPVIHPSGDRIFFTVAHDSVNIGGTRDRGDIYVAELQPDGSWSSRQNLGTPVNNESYNAILGFSQDGSIMFLHHHYTPTGNPGAFTGISYSTYQNGSWTVPQKLDIEYFLNRSTHQSGSITPNGKYLVLSIESYGSRGAEDLYISFYDGQAYSQPQNLGSTINTGLQEMAPYLTADGQTIYFSSNGHGGKGGRDIFKSNRLDDTWRNWSEPENLGSEVNTPGVELYFNLYDNGRRAIYTSTQNSDGYADIKSYKLPVPDVSEPVADTSAFIPPEEMITARDAEPASKTLSGNIINAKSGESIEASITWTEDGGEQHKNVEQGASYSIDLPETTTEITLLVKSQGYMPVQEHIRIDEGGMTKNFFLTPLEVGATIKLDKVYFSRGTAQLIDSSYAELNRIVEVMQENPAMEIELAGHTDNQGDPDKNLELSRKRVEKVKQYLVKKGIEKQRIEGKGYGGSRPIASNASEQTRMLNRRVEFVITKK